MPRSKPKSTSWPFPFFGAGDASYFEWAEVHVLFTREPSKTEKKQLEQGLPLALTDSVDWEGPALMVASDQFAHVAIAEQFAQDGDEDEGDDDDDDDDEGRWFFASSAGPRSEEESRGEEETRSEEESHGQKTASLRAVQGMWRRTVSSTSCAIARPPRWLWPGCTINVAFGTSEA